jgi:hypothetical protein
MRTPKIAALFWFLSLVLRTTVVLPSFAERSVDFQGCQSTEEGHANHGETHVGHLSSLYQGDFQQ